MMLYFLNSALGLKFYLKNILSKLYSSSIILIACYLYIVYSTKIFVYLHIQNTFLQFIFSLTFIGLLGVPFFLKAFRAAKRLLF